MVAQSRLFSWLTQSYQCHAAVICLTGQPTYSSQWEIRTLPPLLAEQHSGNKKTVVKGCWHLNFKDPPTKKKQKKKPQDFSLLAYPCLLPCNLSGTRAKLWTSAFPSGAQLLQPEMMRDDTGSAFPPPYCFPKIILMKGHGWMSSRKYCPDLQWKFPSFCQPSSGPGELCPVLDSCETFWCSRVSLFSQWEV